MVKIPQENSEKVNSIMTEGQLVVKMALQVAVDVFDTATRLIAMAITMSSIQHSRRKKYIHFGGPAL